MTLIIINNLTNLSVLNINECGYYGIWGTATDIKMMPSPKTLAVF